jgi:zinc protease
MSHHLRRASLIGISILVSAIAAHHPLQAQGGTPVSADMGSDRVLPLDPLVTYGKLPNGLTYYIRPNRKPEHRAELRLVVGAGSILEDPDQQGLAHFVEHMAFNGSTNFKKGELINYLESIGVKFGPHLNAYTSFDETVYMFQVPTDSAGQFEKGFQILEDWAHNLSFDDTEIDKERGVVIEEWRLGQGADSRMEDKTFPIFYKGSRYADRLPIGKKEVLDTFRHDAPRRFYHDWYRPDLMAVVAVGDFDPARVEGLIREHFSRIPAVDHPRERVKYPVPDHAETLVALATDREATMTNVEIAYKLPSTPRRTEADYRRVLIQRLFGQMLTSRLDELRNSNDPPFAFAFAGIGVNTITKDAFTMQALTQENKILKSVDALVSEAERVRRDGFTATEFDRARTRMLRQVEDSYNEREKTESGRLVNQYVTNFLRGPFVPGIAADYALAKRFLPGISVQEVNALTGALITRSNRVITVTAPEKEGTKIPDEAALLAAVDGVESKKLENFTDRVPDGPLVAPPAASASVVSESKDGALGITEWKLSNGVRVILKPTEFKNDELLMRAFSPGGSSLAADSDYDGISSASGIIGQSGAGEFNRVALGKKLTGKTVSVYPYIGELNEGIRGNASPRDVETLMQLTHLYFTAPRRDSAGYMMYRTMMESFVKNQGVDPMSILNDTMMVTMSQHHPRRKPFSPQLLDAVDLQKSFDFYRDRFGDAGDFTFVFVGNIDTAALRTLATRYLGTLPTHGRKESWRDIGVHPPAGVIEKTVNAGIEPKSTVRMAFTGPIEWNDRERHNLSAATGVLSIMLREVLREELGGTYGVSVRAQPSRFPRQEYSINISFGCAPERVAELTAAAMRIIDSLKRNGPSDANLHKVKEQARRQHEIDLKDNGFWANMIEQTLQNGESLNASTPEEDQIDDVTAASVQAAAKRYLNTGNYVKVVLYPKQTVTEQPLPAGTHNQP